jgi:hypothetical protein
LKIFSAAFPWFFKEERRNSASQKKNGMLLENVALVIYCWLLVGLGEGKRTHAAHI